MIQARSYENLKSIAAKVVDAYRAGFHVAILAKDESVLHGAETLQAIIESGVRLDTEVIRGVERKSFEGSDLPEICEAARIAWLDTHFRTEVSFSTPPAC